jgi:chemotaxis signal transduction protein
MNFNSRKWIIVAISGKPCALGLEFVQEVLARPILTEPPGMPKILDGYFDLGGVAVAAMSIEHLLGLPKYKLDLYSPIIYMEYESFPLGLQVHRALDVVSLEVDKIRPVSPEESFNGLVTGFAQIKGQTTTFLSVARLFEKKETLLLREFSILAQARLKITRGVEA